MMGIPLAVEKQVNLSHEADFLGLVHNTREVLQTGCMTFKPRDRMLEKAQIPLFWRELETPDAKAVTDGVGKFEDSIRGFILEVVAMSWKNIDKNQLGSMLGMSNPDTFLKSSSAIVQSSIAGNVVEIVGSSGTSDGAGKKQSDLVAKVADISKLISTK